MKLAYGSVPVKALNINYFEQDTNDCDMIASDLQAGKTAVARGQKITGTGKAFEFAVYGNWKTNLPAVVPATINVIQIGSLEYAVKTIVPVYESNYVDFTILQEIAEVTIDGRTYPVTASVQNGMLTIFCEQTIDIELFYGKDNYR